VVQNASKHHLNSMSAKDQQLTEKRIRKALERDDTGMRKITVEFGAGTGTVQRLRRNPRRLGGPND
jgi:hypothetical protein